MLLTIPDDILSSLGMNEEELLVELAVALYATQKISFGTARRLAGLDWYSFREILAESVYGTVSSLTLAHGKSI